MKQEEEDKQHIADRQNEGINEWFLYVYVCVNHC